MVAAEAGVTALGSGLGARRDGGRPLAGPTGHLSRRWRCARPPAAAGWCVRPARGRQLRGALARAGARGRGPDKVFGRAGSTDGGGPRPPPSLEGCAGQAATSTGPGGCALATPPGRRRAAPPRRLPGACALAPAPPRRVARTLAPLGAPPADRPPPPVACGGSSPARALVTAASAAVCGCAAHAVDGGHQSGRGGASAPDAAPGPGGSPRAVRARALRRRPSCGLGLFPGAAAAASPRPRAGRRRAATHGVGGGVVWWRRRRWGRSAAAICLGRRPVHSACCRGWVGCRCSPSRLSARAARRRITPRLRVCRCAVGGGGCALSAVPRRLRSRLCGGVPRAAALPLVDWLLACRAVRAGGNHELRRGCQQRPT